VRGLVHVFHDRPVRLYPILVQHAARELDGRRRAVDFRRRFARVYVCAVKGTSIVRENSVGCRRVYIYIYYGLQFDRNDKIV